MGVRNFILIIFIFLGPYHTEARLSTASKKPLIVLDPGHGGPHDTGALFQEGQKTFQEKDLTLMMALELKTVLEKKGFQVLLTRTQDQPIPLKERTALANRHHAQIFISLHMNASEKKAPQARGVETFILNHTTDEQSKRLAALENKTLEGSIAVPENQDPTQEEDLSVPLILKDLILDGNRPQNKTLGCFIQNSLASHLNGIKNRGVKEGLFYVLLGADMPSVLVELGFMNQAEDRARVTEPQKRAALAASFSMALEHYQTHTLQKKVSPEIQKILSTCRIH